MSENIDDGGPAFPVDRAARKHDGMSLRDWFAGMAMNGLLSDPRYEGTHEQAAEYSYRMADAMLAERKK